jgi:hypothetical protein
MNRRAFTFASLASFGLASVALAGDPTPLEGRWAATVRGGVLDITLTVHNRGSAPRSVVARLGSRPGAELSASSVAGRDARMLTQVPREPDADEPMTRAGPTPHYELVAADGDLLLGTYSFTLSTTSRKARIVVTATVETEDGPVVLEHAFDLMDLPRA